jgi:sRNA-binding protein
MAVVHRNAMMIEDLRGRIESARLVTTLQNHVFNGEKMSKTQVSAAMGLLKKVLPDLATVTHQGGPDGEPVKMTVEQQAEEARASIREAFAEVVKEREHGEAKGGES